MKKTYLFLAEGFEEVEAIAVVDVLRRGGVGVFTVSITGNKRVSGAHGTAVEADLVWNDFNENDAECLIFPGGMPGAQHLGEFSPLMEVMQRHHDRGGWLAAICAAPALVLAQLRARERLCLTVYPGFEESLGDAEIIPEGVVVCGRVITGKGPGFALRFGLKILEMLRSAGVAQEVERGLLL